MVYQFYIELQESDPLYAFPHRNKWIKPNCWGMLTGKEPGQVANPEEVSISSIVIPVLSFTVSRLSV